MASASTAHPGRIASPSLVKRTSFAAQDAAPATASNSNSIIRAAGFSAKRDLTMEEEGGAAVLPKYRCRWAPVPSHIDSSQICQLLCPPPGIRELMIRKGITPRDHFKDNRLAIAQRSALNHAMRQVTINIVPLPKKQSKPKEESQSLKRAKESSIDFVAKNVKEAAQVATRCKKKPNIDDQKHKENFGKIPSYLLRRKIELAQQMEQRLQDEKAHQLPPGYVEMNEDEKDEILRALRENKATLEKKLATLPLVCDTPSQIRAKSNMDLELQDIEHAIKRFSRPHVYISLND